MKKEDRWELRQEDAILRDIVEGTATAIGDEFFRELVRHLATAMGVRYAFVSEFTEVNTRVRTLAYWGGDHFFDNIEFDLSGTPCEIVLSGKFCHYPEKVAELFPKDAGLIRLGAESYL